MCTIRFLGCDFYMRNNKNEITPHVSVLEMYTIKFLGCIFHVSVGKKMNILNADFTCLGNIYHQVLGCVFHVSIG